MKLTFLGTRGEIDIRTKEHGMHTSLLVTYEERRIKIDCGEDWLGKADAGSPHAIVITHAHPDHAWGLKEGAPCPVYATAEAWEDMDGYPIEEKHTLAPRRRREIEGVMFEAFPVDHSTRCPAVAYRVTAGEVAIVYAPDLVYIRDREDALSGLKAYVGDGATLERSFVRKRGDALIGHSPVRTQLGWCEKLGVPRMIVTHCGSEITSDHERAVAKVNEMAAERGVEAMVAHDGLELVLR